MSVIIWMSFFTGNRLCIYTFLKVQGIILTREVCRILRVLFTAQDWISLFLQEQEWFSWNENVHSTASLATDNLQLKPSPFFMLKL